MSSAMIGNLNTADDVDQAAFYVEQMVEIERRNSGTKDAAARQIARHNRVSPSLVRDLRTPSRRPKSIASRCLNRLRIGYLKYIERRIDELRLEADIVKTMGAPNRPVQNLVDEAEALVRDLQSIAKFLTND